MSENQTVELTSNQRELLLEGLRYLRSSRRFEFREPLAPPDPRREEDLKKIATLMNQLGSGIESPVRAER